ncbi:MAG: Fis family two component sigma-54 specific transcriptional regulator [Puniceicoccaceae bacterium 5H]|nr:MAG: Fis family two component sigma-54 specific transcriptional regulator [Puniceicoccaceae bacterium 5H]
MALVLVVDREAKVQDAFRFILEPLGHEVLTVARPDEALQSFEERAPAVTVLEQENQGFALLERMQRQRQDAPILLTSARSRKEDALRALRGGACDFLVKPMRSAEFAQAVARILERQEKDARSTQGATGDGADGDAPLLGLYGENPSVVAMREQIRELVADDYHGFLLIQGESGTYKREIVFYLHEQRPTSKGDFIQMDCSLEDPDALRELLIGPDAKGGSLLKNHPSATLLLEKVESLPTDIQDELDEVIDLFKEQMLIIFLADHDLEMAMAEDRFQISLYFKISQHLIDPPRLRERLEDLPGLCNYILQHSPELSDEQRGSSFTPEALQQMEQYRWPGNLVELESVVVLAALEAEGAAITDDMIRRHLGM